MQKETNYAASGVGRQDFSCISIDTYKAMYKEIYGSLDDFEEEMKNASIDILNILASTLISSII